MDPVLIAQIAALTKTIRNLPKEDQKILGYLPKHRSTNLIDLAADLFLSPSEVIGSIENLMTQGLIEEKKPKEGERDLLSNFSKDLEYNISPLGVAASALNDIVQVSEDTNDNANH